MRPESPKAESPPLSILEQLRTHTRADHEAVEQLVALDQPHFGLAEYGNFLEAMLTVHEPFEAATSRLPELGTWLPDVAERAKSAQLRADLRSLGREPEAPPSITLDVGEALGGLYVLEGSTLGARFVLARVHEVLGDQVRGATSYLEGYGSARAQRWREFGEALERAAVRPSMRASIIAGAQRTFATVRAVMSAGVSTP